MNMNKNKSVLLVASITFVMFFFLSVSAVSADDYDSASMKLAEAERQVSFSGKSKNDPKIVKLYTQAIDGFKKYLSKNNKDTSRNNYAIEYIVRILNGGPNSLRNYPEALQYIYEAGLKEYIGMTLFRMGDFYSAYVAFQENDAVGRIAQLYWLGLGVEMNLPKAMELYKEITFKKGNFNDLYYLYHLDYQIKEYQKGNFDSEAIALFMEYMYLQMMGESSDVLIAKLTQSADLGYPPAQVELCIIYSNFQEFKKAMFYLDKAVDANYVPALCQMGGVYYTGYGKKKDYNKAKECYEKAAEQGDPNAQNKLGVLYFKNLINAEKGYTNKEMAWYWINTAAEQGYIQAAENLTTFDDYRTRFQQIVKVVTGIAKMAKSAYDTYNNINKSNIQSYYPQSSQSKNNTSTSNITTSSTSNNSGGKTLCPICKGSGKCEYQGFGLNYCQNGLIDCSTCKGKGTDKNGQCKTCKGSGKVQCGICHGSGICSRCKGKKWI